MLATRSGAPPDGTIRSLAEHFLAAAAVAVAALFPIIDPIGATPVFLGLTREHSKDGRREQAWRVVVAAVVLLVVFLFFGRFVPDFFGVSPAAVEFAGGLVIGCVLDS